jgi:hypothetical protein
MYFCIFQVYKNKIITYKLYIKKPVGSCELGNRHEGTTKFGEFLDPAE